MPRFFLPTFLSLVLVAALFGASAPDSLAAELKPGEGLVVFTREDKFAGKAIRFNINVDGSPRLQLLAGSTIELPLSPGLHTFSVHTPSLDGQDSLTIDVQEGWTYRIEGYTLLGWPTGRPKFRLISETGPTSGTSRSPSAPKALAGPALGAAAVNTGGPALSGRTAEDSGRIGLRNFVGEWNLEMWSLASDGSKLAGHGVAQGSAEGENSVRIYVTEFEAAAFPDSTGGSQVRITYDPATGFTLESLFEHSGEMLRLTGQYQADTGRYVFYLFGGGGETATGIARKSTRVEIRSLDLATWVADTYSSIDGQSVRVQSYRFSRRQ